MCSKMKPRLLLMTLLLHAEDRHMVVSVVVSVCDLVLHDGEWTLKGIG